jgi:hypothetical protein
MSEKLKHVDEQLPPTASIITSTIDQNTNSIGFDNHSPINKSIMQNSIFVDPGNEITNSNQKQNRSALNHYLDSGSIDSMTYHPVIKRRGVPTISNPSTGVMFNRTYRGNT